MSQQFCLKWNNHMNNMMDVFKNLLSTKAMVNVTLACDGLSLKAHKIVLSACIPFFQSLFLENPCKHPIVILKDMKYTELKAIIEFMYNGEVNVVQDQLSALMKTAETLRVKGLAEVTNEKQSSDEYLQEPRTDTPPPRRRGRMQKWSMSDCSDDKQSEPKIKQPDSPEIEELSGDMDNLQYLSSVPMPSHSTNSFHKSSQQEQPIDQGAEPSKLSEQTLITDDLPRWSGRSSVQSNMELQRRPRSSTDHSTSLVPATPTSMPYSPELEELSGDMGSSQYSSSVPIPSQSTNSFHKSSQQEQPIDQGADESFVAEEKFGVEPSKLSETLTTDDLPRWSGRSSVQSNMELQRRPRSSTDHSTSLVPVTPTSMPYSPEIEELSGDLDNSQYSSLVPTPSHSTNSFHKSSQQEQQIDQGADESFLAEEKFGVEPSNLSEQTLTTDDLPRWSGRSSVQSSMELQRRPRSSTDHSTSLVPVTPTSMPYSREMEELSGDMDNSQYSSLVPMPSHSTNSFHKSSQQEQQIDQGADESFLAEEKFGVEPSNLSEQTLTTDDLPRWSGRSSVQSSMELQRRPRSSTDHSTSLVPVTPTSMPYSREMEELSGDMDNSQYSSLVPMPSHSTNSFHKSSQQEQQIDQGADESFLAEEKFGVEPSNLSEQTLTTDDLPRWSGRSSVQSSMELQRRPRSSTDHSTSLVPVTPTSMPYSREMEELSGDMDNSQYSSLVPMPSHSTNSFNKSSQQEQQIDQGADESFLAEEKFGVEPSNLSEQTLTTDDLPRWSGRSSVQSSMELQRRPRSSTDHSTSLVPVTPTSMPYSREMEELSGDMDNSQYSSLVPMPSHSTNSFHKSSQQEQQIDQGADESFLAEEKFGVEPSNLSEQTLTTDDLPRWSGRSSVQSSMELQRRPPSSTDHSTSLVPVTPTSMPYSREMEELSGDMDNSQYSSLVPMPSHSTNSFHKSSQQEQQIDQGADESFLAEEKFGVEPSNLSEQTLTTDDLPRWSGRSSVQSSMELQRRPRSSTDHSTSLVPVTPTSMPYSREMEELSGDMDNSQYSSLVPMPSHSTNSFHKSSQQEQPIDQGADESFVAEEKFGVEPPKLLEQTLTTDE